MSNDRFTEELLNAVKQSRPLLNQLKHALVQDRKYEAAAFLRDIEKSQFIDDERTHEAKLFSGCLRMTDINTSDAMAWKVLQVARIFLEKGSEYNIGDGAKITTESQQIFGE